MNEKLPTTERLARALEQAGAPNAMITRARAGYYDDFKGPLEQPIKQLVEDCVTVGLHDIAMDAIDGKFDATKEESEAWASSPEGQEVLAHFGLIDLPPGMHQAGLKMKFSRKKRRH